MLQHKQIRICFWKKETKCKESNPENWGITGTDPQGWQRSSGAIHKSVGFKGTLSNNFKSDARSSFRQFFQTEAIHEPLQRLFYSPDSYVFIISSRHAWKCCSTGFHMHTHLLIFSFRLQRFAKVALPFLAEHHQELEHLLHSLSRKRQLRSTTTDLHQSHPAYLPKRSCYQPLSSKVLFQNKKGFRSI